MDSEFPKPQKLLFKIVQLNQQVSKSIYLTHHQITCTTKVLLTIQQLLENLIVTRMITDEILINSNKLIEGISQLLQDSKNSDSKSVSSKPDVQESKIRSTQSKYQIFHNKNPNILASISSTSINEMKDDEFEDDDIPSFWKTPTKGQTDFGFPEFKTQW